MPLKRHVAQLTQAFDHLLWANVCEAAELIGLTPSELVSSILEVGREVKAGEDPLEKYITEEIERRLAAMIPPVSVPEPEDAGLDALESDVRRLIDAVKGRLTTDRPGAAPE